MPTFPGLVSSGQPISSAWGNGIRNALIDTYAEIYAWTQDVDANGNDLTDAAAITATGNISGGIILGGITSSIAADNFVQMSAGAGNLAVTGFHKAGAAAFQVGYANGNATFGTGGFLRQINAESIRFYVNNTVEALSISSAAAMDTPTFLASSGSISIKSQIPGSEGGELRLNDHNDLDSWAIDNSGTDTKLRIYRGGTVMLAISTAGVIQMLLGGTLKTLSLSGSNVIAT